MKNIIPLYLFIAIIIVSCGISCSSSDVTQNISAEDRFEKGKRLYDDGDYLEAIKEFEIVKLQFPGSSVADDAQYYLAESRYSMEEYLLAAEEFQTLKRNMPASSLVPKAQFRTAMCYYKLSPKPELDQRYTLRAIDEFQSFVEYYPANEFVPEAEVKIKELNKCLAEKLYNTAILYMKLEYFKSATIYFTAIVEKYHDTPYAEPALLGKSKALVARKRYAEAKQEIERFFDKYPDSQLKKDAESLRDEIEASIGNKATSVINR